MIDEGFGYTTPCPVDQRPETVFFQYTQIVRSLNGSYLDFHRDSYYIWISSGAIYHSCVACSLPSEGERF